MRRIPRMAVLAALLIVVAAPYPASARCRRCTFSGLCTVDGTRTPCTPTQARCVPKRGLLGFSAELPPVPYAQWIVRSRRRPEPPGTLLGKISVFSFTSDGGPPPAVPGFPKFCDVEPVGQLGAGTCFGDDASFSGLVTGDRLVAAALYPDGTSCDFDLTVALGSDESVPNRYTCRDAAGTVLSEGRLFVDVIRLRGCRP